MHESGQLDFCWPNCWPASNSSSLPRPPGSPLWILCKHLTRHGLRTRALPRGGKTAIRKLLRVPCRHCHRGGQLPWLHPERPLPALREHTPGEDHRGARGAWRHRRVLPGGRPEGWQDQEACGGLGLWDLRQAVQE